MADFYQTGDITTLHILGDKGVDKIERELNHFSKGKRITLLIPALYSDYVKPAMKGILNVLRTVNYLNQVIIAVGKSSKEEFEKAKKELKSFPVNIKYLWVDYNQHLDNLLNKLGNNGNATKIGKGRTCWLAIGFILAQGVTDVVVIHDADIVTYSREMLARLVYPAVNPNLSFDFSKGFYARFSNKIYGRVTRLFIFPLLKVLECIIGNHSLINYLKSFRYPLSGEISLRASLAGTLRFPVDWGLEVNTLYEIYKKVSPDKVCQVELSHRYDHKHQILSSENTNKGLHKMTIDIANHILNQLSEEGVIISEPLLNAILEKYLEISQHTILIFQANATINGLEFNRQEEDIIVRTFYNALLEAGRTHLQHRASPNHIMLSSWDKIFSHHPDFSEDLREILENGDK
jgi:glucosyl-3-phosphoglycerate synthase